MPPSAPPPPVRLAELLDIARDPASARAFSALGDRPYLLVAPDDDGESRESEGRIATWLRAMACPVLSVGRGALSAHCDVQLETLADAAPLIRTIEQAPLAAAVFVQLLRAIERLPLESALLAESLAYSTLLAGPEFRRWLANDQRDPSPGADDAGPAVLATRNASTLMLELNRPSLRNAMSVEMRDALIESLQLALADDTLTAIEIRGRGKCFSTGGELEEFGTAPDPVTAHLVRALALPGRLLAACADRVTVYVHGACIGSGIEFPAFAGRVLASQDAWFQLPELRYGLIPGAGGCVSIGRRIGRQRLASMVLSGARISASQALSWGLVDAIR